MSSDSAIYVGNNSSIAELDELRDHNGNYQNNATATLESLTEKRSGDAVSGVTVPLSLIYVSASDGKYQGAISKDAAVIAGTVYVAKFKAVSASGLEAEWAETVVAQDRVD